MALNSNDKKWVEDKIIGGVVGGINEVVIPALERIEGKIDKNTKELKKVGKKIYELETGLSRVERKLDQRTDHHANRLDDHEDRLDNLETKARFSTI